ncbi:hypothetical protein IQ06DRAFT_349674 [Phaeosphaeriaceae sp. SRC1lsM3a]|nr:hypothetical protein IQ06DRAFT_349674 [Stagonospora sp. SRC1lsM3a]
MSGFKNVGIVAGVISATTGAVNLHQNRRDDQQQSQPTFEIKDPPPSYEKPREPVRPADPIYYDKFVARPTSGQFKTWEEYRQADIRWLDEAHRHTKRVEAQYEVALSAI